jgi:nickel-dependent lactate racemase
MALVVDAKGAIEGVFAGDRRDAWAQAAELAGRTHVLQLDMPLERVISWAPTMYDELWTAGKAVYKLEPALADGAEIIIYTPQLETVSMAHGRYIYQVGYHVLPYFLEQWDRFAGIPLAVLAHSTHVKGPGRFERGVESPRVNVRLATKLTREDCERLNLGYVDPATIDPANPPAGYTVIQRAGEMLYRLKDGARR